MTCGPNAPLDRHDAKAAYSDLPGRLKVSESEKTSVKTTAPQRPVKDSRTTLDVKTDLKTDDVAIDRADDGSSVRYYVVASAAVAALLALRARRRRARRARLRASGGAS
jgi:membrane-bound transcription factor site-1 protease